MSKILPIISTLKSIKTQVYKDQTYYWCSCGLSKTQPFCDGSHIGTDFSPVLFTAKVDAIVGFCGCKFTKTPPICDGYHKNLTQE